MLEELRVENLLLIERAELRLGPGLNVLTGETGAGKTVLAHALDLLLGGKPRAGIVRPGASEAYVEGVFALPDELREELGDRLPEDAEEVVLARRVSAEGRTRAYLGGRSATAADLRDVGGALLSFYGQHEHRKLTLASAQLEILDGFCGEAHAARLQAFGAAYARERELRGAARGARGARRRARPRAGPARVGAAGDRRRRAERGRGGALAAERERLRHLEALLGRRGGRRGARWRATARAPADEGATAAIAGASRALESVRGVDAALDALADRVAALAVEADDLATELRAYGEGVEATPGRLDEVEERLALLDRLKRKHGGTLAAVLAHAEECRRRRDELVGAEEALEGAQAALGEARAELEKRAAELRTAREAAAGALAEAVRERLAALAMDGATFEAALSDRDGYGPSGGDEVEFLIAPEPGRAGRPAARDRLGRRALARDARADGRRGRGRGADAGLRRGRRRHRRPDGAGGRRAAARARRRAAR